MAQLIRITSEALQSTIRRLLPSQQGFGEDLQASNVITPIIDLTPTAEGSSVPAYLQQAVAFGSQSSFTVVQTATTIANTPGFHRVYGTWSLRADSGGDRTATISITDGSTSKNLLVGYANYATSTDYNEQIFDFIAFLRAGDSVSAVTSASDSRIDVTVRQIADVNGNLVNPVGFTSE